MRSPKMRKYLILVCLVPLALAAPAENVTEVETILIGNDVTTDLPTTIDSKPTESKISNPTKVESENKVNTDEEKLKAKYQKIGNKNQGFPGFFTKGPNPFNSKKRPFDNFPDKNLKGEKKHNYMFNLFFGKHPQDIEFVNDNPYQEKEPQFYPPHYSGDNLEMKDHPKFDSFPYEKLAQAYDNNNNNDKFQNAEYTFQPNFAPNVNDGDFQDEEMDGGDFHDGPMDHVDPVDPKMQYDPYNDSDDNDDDMSETRYVFHPYFGYVPTEEIDESDEIMDEINPDELYQLHPRHGFVPVGKNPVPDSPPQEDQNPEVVAMLKEQYGDKQGPNYNDNFRDEYGPGFPRDGHSGEDLSEMLEEQYMNGNIYAPDYPNNREVVEMLKQQYYGNGNGYNPQQFNGNGNGYNPQHFNGNGNGYNPQQFNGNYFNPYLQNNFGPGMISQPYGGHRFEPNFGSNFNINNRPTKSQNFIPPPDQQSQFNRLKYYQQQINAVGQPTPKPIIVEVLKPKPEEVPAIEEIEDEKNIENKTTEVININNDNSSDKVPLKRDRRHPQVYYTLPSAPYLGQVAQTLYQPQYYYNPLQALTPDMRFVQPSFVVQPQNTPAVRYVQAKPVYTLTDAMKSREQPEVGEAGGDDSSVEDSNNVHNFPIEPPGAHVANDPLPETKFPIFPYDPDQDKPAAVAY